MSFQTHNKTFVHFHNTKEDILIKPETVDSPFNQYINTSKKFIKTT